MKRAMAFSLLIAVVLFWSCDGMNGLAPDQPEGAALQTLSKAKKKGPGDGSGSKRPMGQCPDIYYWSQKTLKNGAVVEWTSSFGGFGYEMGQAYTVTVKWKVTNGSAEWKGFAGKKKNTWTPKKDVSGEWDFVLTDGNSGQLTVTMTSLHRSVESDWMGYIGNGHFYLMLDVTSNGWTVSGKFGVNVHLEDPDEGYGSRCPQ